MTACTVPGSILLAGEYRITEDGGPGIAVAACKRAQLQCLDPQAPLTVECREHAGSPGLWRPAETQDNSIIGHVYRKLGTTAVRGHITLDTTAFSSPEGSKRGMGSSAAVAVLVAHYFGQSVDAPLLKTAIEAHRAAQGGQGSGYDVCASYYGGAGLFTGGLYPVWQPFSWPEELNGVLLRGPKCVQTPSALSRYRQWTNECPNDAADWRKQMDQSVTAIHYLLTADKLLDDIFPAFNKAGRLGKALGNSIGVPASPHIPSDLGKDIAYGSRKDTAIKCVGAGDELTLLLYKKDALLKTEQNVIEELIRQKNGFPLEIERVGLCIEKVPTFP